MKSMTKKSGRTKTRFLCSSASVCNRERKKHELQKAHHRAGCREPRDCRRVQREGAARPRCRLRSTRRRPAQGRSAALGGELLALPQHSAARKLQRCAVGGSRPSHEIARRPDGRGTEDYHRVFAGEPLIDCRKNSYARLGEASDGELPAREEYLPIQLLRKCAHDTSRTQYRET